MIKCLFHALLKLITILGQHQTPKSACILQAFPANFNPWRLAVFFPQMLICYANRFLSWYQIICIDIYNIYKKFLFSNRNFGNKIMPIKPLVPKLPKLLEDRDKTVREESKTLIIEIYRWIKQAIKPQMTNFNPIQVKKNVYWVLIVLKWFISLKYFIHICTSLLSMI